MHLLHGLMRTPLSMAPLAAALARHGWRVVNVAYPSRARSIEEHADALLLRIRADCDADDGPFHFVAHSLGCIVVRCGLARCAPDELPLAVPGRFVMLGPPNRGSDLARRLSGTPLWDAVLGKRAFRQLADPALADAWGTPPLPFGIIAGGRGDGRGWNPLLEGDDDGIVSVEHTRLAGAADHLVLPTFHALLPWRRDAMDAVVHFLESGRFATIPHDEARSSIDRRSP